MTIPNMNWTEILCILHNRDQSFPITNTDRRRDVKCPHFLELFIGNTILKDINSLESLPENFFEMPLSQFTSSIPEDHGLRLELKHILEECKGEKAIWLAYTKAPYGPNPKYTHWLPVDPTRLLGVSREEIEKNWEDILKKEYEEFDTLVHVTHIDTASKIFEDELRTNKVRDNSVFSKIPGHPNEATEVIWFGPAWKEKLDESYESRYGNVAFYMDTLQGTEGIRRYPGNWKYYFVEVIDYATQSACRILVTPLTYRHLRPYDPTKKGGPWYYDQGNKKDYWLKDIVRWDGTRKKNGNSLEIMREDYGEWQKAFLCNLRICPVLHLRSERGLRRPCIRNGDCCKFLDSQVEDFDVLTAVYKPSHNHERNVANQMHMDIGSIKPNITLPTNNSSEYSQVYKTFLVDTNMIKNAKSKITFWKNMKTNAEDITRQPFNPGELALACEQNIEVKQSLFELMLGIAAENIVKAKPKEESMDGLPYSLREILQFKLASPDSSAG